jgi:dihydroorotate dehydrogenase
MDSSDRVDLELPSKWMNQAGTLGFSPRERLLPMGSVFVTNPVSARSRVPSEDRAMLTFPGGFLLHTGLPNAGWKSIRRSFASHWEQSDSPVWVHLISQDPQELESMVRDCEEMEGVSAIELGLPPACSVDWMRQLTQAARGEKPLVAHISLGEDIRLVRSLPGFASAVTLGTPRGTLTTSTGRLVHGRLHGPGLFPQMLDALLSLRGLDIPVILGGVCTMDDANAALKHGAAAVQIDHICWSGELPDRL